MEAQQLTPTPDLLNLAGKTAVVTGAAKGIGKGIAARLSEAGANVVVADIDESAARQTAAELAAKGGKVASLRVDVGDETNIANMVAGTKQFYGSLDILVNNAGIYPPKPVAAMTAEDFEKVMHINLRSVFLTTKYAAEIMKAQKGGRIINITSIDALHPSMVGLAHYDASKHGVWGFTKNAALELAEHTIWVNAVAPGGIATPGVAAMSQGGDAAQTEAFMQRIPMHRMGEPDEIGKVVLFLASDMASYMTGSQIVVDGGALLR